MLTRIRDLFTIANLITGTYRYSCESRQAPGPFLLLSYSKRNVRCQPELTCRPLNDRVGVCQGKCRGSLI